MRSEYLILIIAGLVILAFSYTLVPQTTHHMMMHSPYYSTLPSILALVGILLILIPIILNAQSERYKERGENVNSNNQKESEENAQETKKYDEKLAIAEKLLEEDERKVLRIIAENEGITQDSLHFRTGFSTSKISMIIKKLEEKDLIYRERFGKTYRIYLSEWVKGQG
ncbi:transcriptional regulator, MarR family [Ferroglobus placidus DSM 10642]|uniref:Transcriptional regulator, MarR family n=1 Tax=Ferroglobus placidus (strain DSM 10642 / AEDII12DO) TaxID=589924 RepID=D3RX90_FERPA|nr:MarR family transcriptional regulator [Ferroglobus placidus]ADC65103.1 transcriptional regulator, MarR family [Ferroglobus placidus DSM 10642]